MSYLFLFYTFPLLVLIEFVGIKYDSEEKAAYFGTTVYLAAIFYLFVD